MSASPSPSNSTVVTCDTAISVNTEATEVTTDRASSASGSGADSVTNSETRSFSPPSWRGLMEVWQAGDILPTGEVIRCSPIRPHSIDVEKGLLIEGEEKEGGVRVVPIGRSRKIPRKAELPIFLERHSRVEVWAKSPGLGNGMNNCQGRKYSGKNAWYLAEVSFLHLWSILLTEKTPYEGSTQTNFQVIGFKGRDKLCVRYFFDGETEDVPRVICRLVNPNRPNSCIEDLMKEFPDLVETVLEKDKEFESWNSEGDEATQKNDQQEKEPTSFPLPLTPVTPAASRRFPTPKRQRKSESNNNNNVFGIIGVHPSALYGEYCKERDVLDAQVKATQLERMKKEEDRGRAAKELEDITEQCRLFSIAETQSLVRARYPG